ncbi:MAG: response regulator [Anaerolineae bacterium]|nr:response regulator [Anaerolineae bacterium]NUQ02502.1 response regulator [Anaerolineae bacterium]
MTRQTKSDSDKPLVLVVDDEINTTVMLQYIFEREGFRVERVTDGVLAIEAAEALHPDLVLLDILLPRMNGFEVLARLKASPITEHIPTILITANLREPSDVAQGLDLGADDYLQKPFAPQELLARVQSKLRARQLEEKLRRRSRELEFLLAASERLGRHLQREEVLNAAIELARELVTGDFFLVQLVDDNGNMLGSVSWASTDENSIPEYVVDIQQWLKCEQQSSVWMADPQYPPRSVRYYNGMCGVIQSNNQIIGVLAVASRRSEYTKDQSRLLVGLGRHVAMALRNAEYYQLQKLYTQELESTVLARTTELVEAQRLLTRNEKLAAIGHLAASIAHEINNPLMPIGLLLEQFEEGLRSTEHPIDLDDLQVVRENVLRIQRIVRSLLDFARQDIELRILDVGQLLESVQKLNQHSFEMERKKLSSSVEKNLQVYGSKDQLEAVFMNLALNAQAALGLGGRLNIQARAQGDKIVILFEDNGHGIPQENIDRIFDPFFSTKQNGSGLGLFVCYGVIEGHHGTIGVESEVGKGTRFTICLPRPGASG